MKQTMLIALLYLCYNSANAQCPGGQVQVSIEIRTDDYGYEAYWQLVPSGNPCGTGTVFTGGITL